jgi:TonB family protein
MKLQSALVILTILMESACWGQETQKKSVPPECAKTIRLRGSFPKGPFKFLPKESYKRSPLIKYQIQEDGTASDALVSRSSGVADVDRKVLEAIEHWKYKPRPAGCGAIETERSVIIDYGDSR